MSEQNCPLLWRESVSLLYRTGGMPAFCSEGKYYFYLLKLLYKHLEKIVWKKGNQCLCWQDRQK